MVSEDEERDGEGTRRRREEPEEALRDVIYVQVRISRLMFSCLCLLFLPGGLLQKGRIIQKRRISEKGRLLSQQSGRSESYREGPRRTGEGCQYFKASQ